MHRMGLFNLAILHNEKQNYFLQFSSTRAEGKLDTVDIS